MKLTKTSVFHPFLFAIFPVLMIYANNIYIIPFKDTIYPILLVIIFSCLVFFINKLIFKSWKKSGIITSIIMTMVFSYGHIYLQIGGFTIGDFIIGRHRYFMIPYIIGLAISAYYIFKTKRKLDNATKILNAIAITLMLMIFVNIGFYAIDNNVTIQQGLEKSIEQGLEKSIEQISTKNIVSSHFGEPSVKRDIYHIILDGYGGYQSLKNNLGFDNKEFLDALENRGFYIDSNSYSNYPETILSIPSILNMKYFNYLTDEIGENSQEWHPMYEVWKNPEVMMNLESRGYTTIHFESPEYQQNTEQILCKFTTVIPNNELMRLLSKISIFEHFTYAFSEQEKRERILCAFSELSEIGDREEGPIFIHAHMMIPHPPYLFDSNGERIIYKPYHDDDELDSERYLGTLQYANKRIIEIVDNLQKQDTQPIIIIQSDHGSDFNNFNWNNPTDDMIKQRMSNLNTYYFPDGGNEFLYEGMTPVNSFRMLFNVYFNSTYPILEDKNYWSNYAQPYNFTDVTKIVNEN